MNTLYYIWLGLLWSVLTGTSVGLWLMLPEHDFLGIHRLIMFAMAMAIYLVFGLIVSRPSFLKKLLDTNTP